MIQPKLLKTFYMLIGISIAMNVFAQSTPTFQVIGDSDVDIKQLEIQIQKVQKNLTELRDDFYSTQTKTLGILNGLPRLEVYTEFKQQQFDNYKLIISLDGNLITSLNLKTDSDNSEPIVKIPIDNKKRLLKFQLWAVKNNESQVKLLSKNLIINNPENRSHKWMLSINEGGVDVNSL